MTDTATMEEAGFKPAEPQAEHRWLTRMVGDWTFEADCDMGPDRPRAKTTGAERVRSLGGLWIVGEGTGEMPGGGAAETLVTVGFDPAKGRFVGSWQGSMMTHMWVYDGELDAAGRVLTLNAEGPIMGGGGGLAKYRDVVEFESDDVRTLRSRVLGADGSWTEFMVARYRRTR